MTSEAKVNPVLVGLGEILWDVFPDGPRFGGAPSNFACSAAELAKDAAQVVMLSAVGDDELGDQALDALRTRGVDTSFVQRNAAETGQVHVTLDSHGVASYRFAEDSAWDNLQWDDEVAELATRCDAVCFGTLGQRDARSRDVIGRFIESCPPKTLKILDVNLRSPFYNDDVIDRSLTLANVLKLNEDELPHLARIYGMVGDELAVSQQLLSRFELRYVALTRGPRGSLIIDQTAVSDLDGWTVDVVDTVGAGDAFTAAMTLGICFGEPLGEVNVRASAAASHVCSCPGATTAFPAKLCFSSRADP